MNIVEHQKIVNKLQNKYGNKVVRLNTGEIVKTRNVVVDFRKSHQHMNRVETDFGGYVWINEISEVLKEFEESRKEATE